MAVAPRQSVCRPLVLAAACLALAGCPSFRFGPMLSDKPDKSARANKEPALVKPGKHSFRIAHYVFHSDVELPRSQPLFRDLADLNEQVCKELELPCPNTLVEVYVFEDRQRYERFMHARYPNLPNRRAFFVAQPHAVGGTEDLLVYTYWGERTHVDLRHELTHALLHSLLKGVPLWLDEGLAEYFEQPADRKGINAHHLVQIDRGGGPFKPDLVRLEKLSEVQHMSQAEYREAWAWVHLMLRSQPEARRVLLGYLQELRTNANPGPLQPRLAAVYPSPEEALVKHVGHLDPALPATAVQR
jgi:hypothetical protein